MGLKYDMSAKEDVFCINVQGEIHVTTFLLHNFIKENYHSKTTINPAGKITQAFLWLQIICNPT